MYTSIPNLVLVNLLHFRRRGGYAPQPLCPQIRTSAGNPLDHRLSVALLEQYGARSIGHSFEWSKALYWQRKGHKTRFELMKQHIGVADIPTTSSAMPPIHVACRARAGCLHAKVVDSLYPIEKLFRFLSIAWT